MGGSSGGGPSKSDLEKLEQLAKKTLREPEDSGRRNVFISFAHEDLAEVNLLRGQARNEDSNLEFNDWSLREPSTASGRTTSNRASGSGSSNPLPPWCTSLKRRLPADGSIGRFGKALPSARRWWLCTKGNCHGAFLPQR